VLNLLSDLQQASGLTYVSVTPDLGVLVHLCDRFAVMREGKIVETLRRADLDHMEARHPYTRMLVEASSRLA